MRSTTDRLLAVIAVLVAVLVLLFLVDDADAHRTKSPHHEVTKQERAKYVGLRVAAKKVKIRVGEPLRRSSTAERHANEIRRLRAKLAAYRYAKRMASGGAGGIFLAIRKCESGNRYGLNTGNGFYGAYQFTVGTWRAYGGTGMPHLASPGEQDRIAARLYRAVGTHTSASWPNCP